MKKIISILLTAVIIFASAWAMVPAAASELSAETTETPDVGLCDVHDFGDYSVVITATCTENEYSTATCKTCGYVNIQKTENAAGHNFGDPAAFTSDKEAGTHTAHCTVCDQDITEDCVFELTDSELKCAASVLNTYTCKTCGATVERTEAAPHNVTKWTAVNGTSHKGTCEDCKEEVTVDCVFTETEKTVTCIKDGVITYKCECGNIKTKNEKALGHNYTVYLNIGGKKLHAAYCSRCGATDNEACSIENTAMDTDTATHTGSCTYCLAAFTDDCVAGEYKHVKDSANHEASCVGCTRIFTQDCTADENGFASNGNGTHSATCEVCKGSFTLNCSAESYTPDEEKDGYHKAHCPVCDADFEAACVIETYEQSFVEADEENPDALTGYIHKGACKDCGKEYTDACTGSDYEADLASGKCTGKCMICKKEMQHDSKLVWEYDAENGKCIGICDICNVSTEHEAEVADWTHVEGKQEHEGTCSVCENTVSEKCVVDEWSVLEDAEAASHKGTCTECGEEYAELCENISVDEVNSTKADCENNGYTYYICDVCGQRDDSMTRKENALGHNLRPDESVEIVKTEDGKHVVAYICDREGCDHKETKEEAHKWGDAVKGENKKHTLTCSVCKETKEEDCTAEKMPGKAATCTVAGLTEGEKCKECGAVLKAQETIPATAKHDFKFVSTTATCTNEGKSTYKCSICGETTEAHAGKTNHVWKVVNRKAATKSEDGFEESKCENCTATYKRIIPAGQTEAKDPNAGVESILAPAAAIVLLSGASFLGVNRSKRKDENEE